MLCFRDFNLPLAFLVGEKPVVDFEYSRRSVEQKIARGAFFSLNITRPSGVREGSTSCSFAFVDTFALARHFIQTEYKLSKLSYSDELADDRDDSLPETPKADIRHRRAARPACHLNSSLGQRLIFCCVEGTG